MHGDGYQNVNVEVSTGSGLPAGGLVTVPYSSGPTSNYVGDALRAERIVWDTYPGRFGALSIVNESGECVVVVCSTQSSSVDSATYAQLDVRFGPRPHGLDTASAGAPRSLVIFGLVIAAWGIAAAAILLTLVLRRKRRRPPGHQVGWPPGPPSR